MCEDAKKIIAEYENGLITPHEAWIKLYLHIKEGQGCSICD